VRKIFYLWDQGKQSAPEGYPLACGGEEKSGIVSLPSWGDFCLEEGTRQKVDEHQEGNLLVKRKKR